MAEAQPSPARTGTLRETKKKKTPTDADVRAYQFLRKGLELRNKALELLNKIHELEESQERKKRQLITRNVPEAMALFNQAIDRFQEALLAQPQHYLASFYLAFTLYQKSRRGAGVEEADLTSLECDNALKDALVHLENALKFGEKSKQEELSIHVLWGMIFLQQAKRSRGALSDQESLLINAGEKLLKAVELNPTHDLAQRSLNDCLEALVNSQKDRARTGKAIYHVAGEFTKEGGSIKSWKTRWFVVDDSSISYYKDKQDWENGPVIGAPAKPQGSILFSEILDVTRHDDPSKCTGINQRPAPLRETFCLHVLTKNRTYNILGFPKLNESTQWCLILKNALRLYNVKKKSKTTLRDKRASSALEKSEAALFTAMAPKDWDLMEATLDVPVEDAVLEDLAKRAPVVDDVKATITLNFDETDHQSLTPDELSHQLQHLDDRLAKSMAKKLLKQFQKEGHLVSLIMALVEEDPRQFLMNVSDVSDWKRAKFGGLQKVQSLLGTPTQH